MKFLLDQGLARSTSITLALSHAAAQADSETDALMAQPEVVKAWKDMRYGMFLCWGPVSLTGREIGWSRGAPAWGRRPGVRGGKGPTPADARDQRQFGAARNAFALPDGTWWGGSTHKDNMVYLHVLRWPSDTILLPDIGRKVVDQIVLTGGNAKVTQTDQSIAVSVPSDQRDPLDTVIRITFDRSVTDMLPISEPSPDRGIVP